jgi:hypothetical protein
MQKPINDPIELRIGSTIVCKHPSETTTKGKKYRVMSCFNYLNKYGGSGSGREVYYCYDTFVTLKNDYGFTVKMNLSNFDYEEK